MSEPADPDRLFPAEATTRAVARELYEEVARLPILAPHGHVDPTMLADDRPFSDPARLLVAPDHYVTRLLHANGVPMQRLIPRDEGEARETWRLFCAHWTDFEGTASGYWLSHELRELFDVDLLGSDSLDGRRADELFARISAVLARDDFRPKALLDRFGIEVLATTDDPLDDLDAHSRLRSDPRVTARVVPTFRPDAYLDPESDGWVERVDALIASGSGTGSRSGTGTGSGSGTGTGSGSALSDHRRFLDALAQRRRYFIEHGAVSADHGITQLGTLDLDPVDAGVLFDRLRAGKGEPGDAAAFRAHALFEMARMSVDDGLVMTLHPGVLRNHHPRTADAFGPDTGHDIPVATEFTRALRPLLSAFGTAAGFHLVLFTVDETSFSRELAPLAGFYPSVYLGSPWWFLDAPDAIARFRAAVTETAGFTRSSGFVDDTRGFCSIPVRHDAARRVEAGFLARLVVEGRLSRARARAVIVDLIDGAPRRVFKL